jgi:hypothetical protein
MAVEVVSKLTPDEKALFLDILYSAFKQIENGEPVTVPDVDGVMSVILDEAITELQTGFDTYMKRVNARNKADQESEKESLTDHRPINDTSMTDNRREEKRIEKKEQIDESDGKGTGGTGAFEGIPADQEQRSLYLYQLNQWLSKLGIAVDDDILTAWKEYGFDAIRKAVPRFNGVKPPVKKSVFLDLVREEGNRH